MVASVLCIGAAAGTASDDDESEQELEETGGRSKALNGVLAIVTGLGGPVVISTQHILIRKYIGQYNGLEMAFDAELMTAVALSFFLIPLSGNPDFTIT